MFCYINDNFIETLKNGKINAFSFNLHNSKIINIQLL